MITIIEGLALGLAYAMPIGIQNLFVMQQALAGNRWSAYFTAFCVSVSDVTLALACFFGIGKVLEAVPSLRWALLITGAAFIVYTAIGLLRSKEREGGSAHSLVKRQAIARTAFVLTWLNPHAIVDGSVLLGGYSAKLHGPQVAEFLVGLVIASPLWFFSLTTIALYSAQFLTPKRLLWVNRGAGAALLILAVGLIKAAIL